MTHPKVGLADRVFFTADSVTAQHVATLGTFEKPRGAGPDFVEQLMTRLRASTSVTAPLNYRLVRPALRAVAPSYEQLPDSQIDLDAHLTLHRLPGAGGERELGELVSARHSEPIDMSRPLWEFDLIDGLEGDRFGVYFKVHHAVMDGVAGSTRIQQMLSPDRDDAELRPIWGVGARPDGPATPAPAVSISAIATTARTVGGLAAVTAGLLSDQVRPTDPDLAVPFKLRPTMLNKRIGAERRIATQTIEFARIRAAAKAGGVTVNDVFLAICAGGLRTYLAEHGPLPTETLIAGTPVNVRAVGDDGATNAFSMTVMKMGTDIADPVERLRAINRSSTLAKQRLAALPADVVANYPALFMGPLVGAGLLGIGGHVRPPYHVSVSNVPGPTATQYWAGARLEAMYPLGQLYHGLGLFIAALTISGRFCVGVTGDAASLPHLQHLAVAIGAALDELAAALP